MGICIEWYKVEEAKRVLKNNRIMLVIENKTKERQTFPVEEIRLDSKKKKYRIMQVLLFVFGGVSAFIYSKWVFSK